MEPDPVPFDLAVALRAAGYRVAGPVGVGSHGPAWAAVGLPDGHAPGARVVVTELAIPAGAAGAWLRERLDVLGALVHEHLAAIVDVVALDDLPAATAQGASRDRCRCAVLLAEVPGVNLAVLLAARPPLSDGEAVTLVVPLAQALAALHDAGLVHGDVSPANVVVRPDGRPVLVDLLGALTAQAGSGDGVGAVARGPGGRGSGGRGSGGRGTPGFAAPEAERGDRPEPPGDVYAVARTVLAALAGGGAPALRDVLELACSPDPAVRPSAIELPALCFAAAPPEPLSLPDAAVLARTTLALLATEPSPRSAMTVRPSRSRHRESRRRRRALVGAVAAVGALAACGALASTLIARGPLEERATAGTTVGTTAGPTTASPTTPTGESPAGPTADSLAVGTAPASGLAALRGSTDPVAAAVALTERRAVLLAAGDPDALAEIEVVGASAHTADLALLADLAEAGVRIQGLEADVVSGRLVDPSAMKPAVRVRVEVRSSLTAHRRVTVDGATSTEVPAQPTRTVVLMLAWTTDGWRVADVT